jgi:hypothetical protein
MSTAITLPSPLRTCLAAIRRRARLLRAVRGLGILVLVLVLSAAAAVLADYWLDLSALMRQVLFSVWLAAGAGWLLLGVVVPLARRLDAAALAAVIEEKYPDLGERLTSAVELADASDEGHGSPVLIALLLEDTAERSARLDFRPALPARRAGIVAALAAVVVLLAMAPAFVWTQPYNELTHRFFRPWDVTPAAPPYDIAVSPGDAVAALGRPVTLSARLAPRDEKIVLPDVASLLVVAADGKETRYAMQRADNGDFTFAYKLPSDISYRIEAGEVVSDSYRLTAITPVELAADSPTITVTPPAYARTVKEDETFHGLVDLSALQHSAIRFDFRFSRPAAAAYMEWIAPSKTNEENVTRHPLTLSADRQAAGFSIPAQKEGKYRLVLEAEHAILTELPGGTVHIQPDQPPSVLKFGGKEEQRAVLSDEPVPLEIETADDIAVAGVELEYRINDGETVREALELQGGNTPSAAARHVLQLSGKVKEDDRVRYRFRVRDNLPKEYQGPHVIVYPADRWLTLRIARRGDPRRQQEILAQRDDINRRLDAIRQSLLQEKRGVYKVRQETRDQTSLPSEQLDNLKQLQRDNRTSQKALREVAQRADDAALQPVAEVARAVADREMHKSEQALVGAASRAAPAERTRRFDRADEQLASAVKRLEELRKTNDRLAQERLDRAKLETLAEREKRLAEQATELTTKHPVLDPKARELAEKLKREQAEVAQELERLAQQSEPLKQALEQARREQARQMSERARELAQAQRELTRAEAETQRQREAERLADLARRQQELAQQQTKLAEQTRPANPAAQTPPLKTEEAQRAADALKQGNAPQAVRHQDQAVQELERLAQAFERAVKVSADPKEAARQLEQAENALRQRVREEMAKPDGKEPLSERLKPLHQEQDAIRQAADRLSVPPHHAEANKVKQQIGERAGQAAEALQKRDAPRARTQMEETRNLLHRLADLLPNLEQRRQQARREVERLRRQQEDIARQLEQIKKDDPSAAQRLAEAARRQAESAESLSKMDAPNREQRRERTTDALNRALADLLDGRREDLAASQQEAKRQLERLEQALRGEKPADERARALAEKQRKLVEDARRAEVDAKTTPQLAQPAAQSPQQMAKQMAEQQRQLAKATENAAKNHSGQDSKEATQKKIKEIAKQQSELNRRASRLPANSAQRGLEQARVAMNKAEQALARSDAAKAQQKQSEAANALDRLAAQLPTQAAAKTPSETPSAAPRGLPSKEQSDQARQLARQQRELREAVQRATQPARAERPVVRENPIGELSRRQEEVAKQAAELARNVDEEQGEKAAVSQQARQAQQAAQQASRQMQAGALPQAQRAGQQSAEQLRQLASQLARTPRKGDPQAPDALQQTRQLEKQQEDINRRLQPLAADARAQAAQQQDQQRNLQQEAGALMRQLQQLTQQARSSWPMQSALERATGDSLQAQRAMQQSREQGQRGESATEKQSQERAAQALDRAARAASDAAKPMTQAGAKPGSPKSGSPKAGEAVAQAGKQMADAQGQLNRGKPAQAQSAMKQAAESLAQAAKQMADGQQKPGQPGQPGQPRGLGRVAGGLPDLRDYGLDKTPHAGKSWGELPGELRTKIVQDMKSRYGDDYARMIKYYFEHIADTTKK